MAIQFSIKPQPDGRDRRGAGDYPARQIRMIECRVCRASNGSSRDACFNCGTVLRVSDEAAKEFVRVVFADIPLSL